MVLNLRSDYEYRPMTRLIEIFLSPIVFGTRGVVIHGALADKGDDAIMVASSAKGGPSELGLPIQSPWGNKDYPRD